MTITLAHVNPAGTRVYMGTLTAGADVHAALAGLAHQLNVRAGTVELLGGLSEAAFSEYDFIRQTRGPELVFQRALEIVAGHGTFSLLDGAPFVHLHLVCAFREADTPVGIRVIGGHLTRARAFAVEFTLLAFDGAPVQRALHSGTGLKLWHLPLLTEEAA